MPGSDSSLEVGRSGSHLGKFTPTHGSTGKLPVTTVGATGGRTGTWWNGAWMLSDLQGPGPPTREGLAHHFPGGQPRGKITAAVSHSSTALRP